MKQTDKLIMALGVLFCACNSPVAEPESKDIGGSVPKTEVTPEPAVLAPIGNNHIVIGTYTYSDGAHSFVPCGSKFNEPLIPGNALDRLIALSESYGGSVVLKLQVHTEMGPAAEGDGAEEYIAVDKVLGEANCP